MTLRMNRRGTKTSIASLASLAVGMLVASVAIAFIPQVERTMRAIAKVNRTSGRTQAIQLKLTMSVGDRGPIASGELISHPSGLARLEIRGYRGRVDRYLLSGAELLAAKDGRRLDHPQPMLQPFFLLQPSTETTLRAAIEAFGVQSEWIGLAPCGEQDCFVIGDPRLAAPLPTAMLDELTSDELDVLDDPLSNRSVDAGPAIVKGEEGDGEAGLSEFGDESESKGPLAGPTLSLPKSLATAEAIPRLWVDTRELQVRRIDRASGVFIVFGPIKSFEKLKVPAWFEIHDPEASTVRFEVDEAVAVNAPPQAFSQKWLLTPPAPATESTTFDPESGSGPLGNEPPSRP
jgi:hypothetical protein